jgi:two-component system sensor histidine kinase KdpD
MEMDRQAAHGSIVVAIGPAPSSASLVRWTKRMAAALGREWLAVHIDQGTEPGPGDAESLDANLALARESGAEVVVRESPDVAAGIVEAARERGASLIVIGRSGLSRLGLLPRRPTISDRIVREAEPIDVAVVQDADAPRKDLSLKRLRSIFEAPLREYLLLLAGFVAATAIGFLLRPLVGYRSIALVYLSAVLGLSFFARPAPVALFAVLSAVFLNFFFMTPQFTLRIAMAEDLFLFVTYFLVAFVTGGLVARLRLKEKLLVEREGRDAFLLSATQQLAECHGIEEAAGAAVALLGRHFSTRAFFLVPAENGLAPMPAPRDGGSPDAESLLAAARAFRERRICGRGTAEVGSAALRCFPVAIGESAEAVIAIGRPESRSWRPGDDGIVLSLGRDLALIAGRERAAEMRRKAAMAIESERLSKVLLDSVSHELRTPLTTITGSMSALRDNRLAEDAESRRILVDGALEAADFLNRTVEDILSMSRIESGRLELRLSLVDLPELANEALALAGPELQADRVRLELPEEALPAKLDFVLVSRLAANLLRNAARYSPAAAGIELTLSEDGDDLSLRVRDHGPGVPEAELESIFERFRRGGRTGGRGLGLGLAICRGIAAAHGGSIVAHNAQDGGLVVTATFPGCVGRAGS